MLHPKIHPNAKQQVIYIYITRYIIYNGENLCEYFASGVRIAISRRTIVNRTIELLRSLQEWQLRRYRLMSSSRCSNLQVGFTTLVGRISDRAWPFPANDRADAGLAVRAEFEGNTRPLALELAQPFEACVFIETPAGRQLQNNRRELGASAAFRAPWPCQI